MEKQIFPLLLNGSRIGKKENPKESKVRCFFIPIQEIIKNEYDLSISRYREIVYEEEKYGPPNVILNKIEEIQKEIDDNIKELRDMLNE